MPTIEITQADADALERGESVTITPPKPELHIVVHRCGTTYLVRGPLTSAEWRIIRSAGDLNGSVRSSFSEWQPHGFNFEKYPDSYTIIPVQD